MFTVTLITNPAMYLDPALVSNLRNAMGGGDAVWLDPNHAAEFEVARLPKNLDGVWNSLQAEGVDMVAQPTEGRRKKMLLADMDSTMIRQECIDELADEAGVGNAVKSITQRAMNGELDFEGALTERVKLLRGLPEATHREGACRSHHADAGRRNAGGDDEGAWRLCRAGVGRVRVLQFRDRREARLR
jgi:phosphoserine phosphatase